MAITVEHLELKPNGRIELPGLNGSADCRSCKDMGCHHINTNMLPEQRADHPCAATITLPEGTTVRRSGSMNLIMMKGGGNK